MSRVSAEGVLSQHAPRWLDAAAMALVIAGAGLCAAVLLYDYFAAGFAQQFGARAALGLALGAGAIVLGAGLQIAAPDKRAEALRFWAVAAQLALLGLVCRIYQIENRAFYEVIFPLMAAGYIVHHQLAQPLRGPFFVAIALSAFVLVLVPADPAAGAWLIGIAGALTVLVCLPIPIVWRVLLLAGAGAALAALRVGAVEAEWAGVIAPILASMFMFRAAIFLYDDANGKGPKSFSQRIAYFFLPPNVVFPFFPVVDFATFGRTYYNAPATAIYQRGAGWVLRGIVHLLLYRIVYLYGVIGPEDVDSGGDFVRFVVTNFGLYLRISGLFHLIVGLLLLFGYNLPETHTRFYFSTSFMDFWRRINIYWKDFMQKMVFNPVFMRLRRIGTPHLAGVILSMFAVFFATWALHAYNWFWLRGTLLFNLPDMLFWALLACFLALQTLVEARKSKWTGPVQLGPQAYLVLRTVCTFAVICLMWSLWTSESFDAWVQLWAGSGLLPALGEASIANWLVSLAVAALVAFMVLVTAGVSFGLAPASAGPARAKKRAQAAWAAPAAVTAAAAGLLLAQGGLVGLVAGERAQAFALDMREPRLNARDAAMLERGYYENLTNVNEFNSRLWELYMARPNQSSAAEDAPFYRARNDHLSYDYLPNTTATFNGVEYRINRWGMRDDDVALTPAPGVLRIAIAGPSHACGWGVELEDRFDKVMAPALNARRAAGSIETLNFAIDGYELSERIIAFDEKSWDFQPAIVLFIANPIDLLTSHLADMFMRGTFPRTAWAERVAAAAGLRPGQSRAEVERRLHQARHEVTRIGYSYFAAQARARGVTPVWVNVPLVEANVLPAENASIRRSAEQAGFVILDLSHVFDGQDRQALMVSQWDGHPNARGHRLIAQALAEGLLALDAEGAIDLGLAR